MASRTQVAGVVAERLARHDRRGAVRAAAAWMVSTGRARQARYLARDVATALAGRGYVLAEITTARPLHEAARAELVRFIKQETGAHEVELELIVDASVIGGVRIETPAAMLDATVQTKLNNYVEGALA